MTTVFFAEIWWQILLLAIGSYLVGNVNFAILISKLKKKDIREQGSGNPGTMNMLRNFGIKIGLLTLILDALKGFLPTLAGKLIFAGMAAPNGFCWSDLTAFLCGLFAVIGHIFPVFLGFKGGKGVATTIGIFVCMQPLTAIALFLLMLIYIYKFEYGSVGSMLFVTCLSIIEFIYYAVKYQDNFGVESGMLYVVLALLCFLCYFAHRSNIKRLIRGKENRTKLKDMIAKFLKRNPKTEEQTETSGGVNAEVKQLHSEQEEVSAVKEQNNSGKN